MISIAKITQTLVFNGEKLLFCSNFKDFKAKKLTRKSLDIFLDARERIHFCTPLGTPSQILIGFSLGVLFGLTFIFLGSVTAIKIVASNDGIIVTKLAPYKATKFS
jgi:hypothetical protein